MQYNHHHGCCGQYECCYFCVYSRVNGLSIVFSRTDEWCAPMCVLSRKGTSFMPDWLIDVYYSFVAVSSTLTQLMGVCPGEVTVSIEYRGVVSVAATIQTSLAMCGPRKGLHSCSPMNATLHLWLWETKKESQACFLATARWTLLVLHGAEKNVTDSLEQFD